MEDNRASHNYCNNCRYVGVSNQCNVMAEPFNKRKERFTPAKPKPIAGQPLVCQSCLLLPTTKMALFWGNLIKTTLCTVLQPWSRLLTNTNKTRSFIDLRCVRHCGGSHALQQSPLSQRSPCNSHALRLFRSVKLTRKRYLVMPIACRPPVA